MSSISAPGEKLADAGDALQPRDIGIALRERLDRRLAFLDPAVDVVDQGKAAVDLQPVDRRHFERCKLLAAGLLPRTHYQCGHH